MINGLVLIQYMDHFNKIVNKKTEKQIKNDQIDNIYTMICSLLITVE